MPVWGAARARGLAQVSRKNLVGKASTNAVLMNVAVPGWERVCRSHSVTVIIRTAYRISLIAQSGLTCQLRGRTSPAQCVGHHASRYRTDYLPEDSGLGHLRQVVAQRVEQVRGGVKGMPR